VGFGYLELKVQRNWGQSLAIDDEFEGGSLLVEVSLLIMACV